MDYEKAFGRAKSAYGTGAYDDATLEFIFPQLAESEDERIRKFLIDYFTSYKIGNVTTKLNGVRIDDILAYLEKQKEPHFTKRNALFDKCVENCDPEIMKRVSDEVDEMLQKEQKPAQSDVEREYVRTLKSLISDFLRGKEEVDREYYQRIYDWLDGRHIEHEPAEHLPKEKVFDIMRNLTALSYSERIPINSDEYGWIHKITEDVRSLLDDPIEQKPAEMQDYSGLTDLEKAIHRGFLSAGVENVPVTIIKETANECKRTQTIANENANAEWSEEDNIGWDEAFACVTKTERAAKDEGELQNAVTAEKWLKEIKFKYYVHPVKQEWSDEDEKMAYFVNQFLEFHESSDPTANSCKKWFNNRFKSLRPQPKQEWSEEDKLMIKCCLKALEYYKYTGKHGQFMPARFDIGGYLASVEKVENWLKSIRPVSKESLQSWKPSEEQMKALSEAVYTFDGYEGSDAIKSLYNDLKKLM